MLIAKWGNSLAVRLPASLVSVLNLKEGDDIELGRLGETQFVVSKKHAAPTLADSFSELRHILTETGQEEALAHQPRSNRENPFVEALGD